MTINDRFLDLAIVSKSVGEVFDVEYSFDFKDFDPSFSDSIIKGQFSNIDTYIYAKLDFSGTYLTVCDRCLDEVVVQLKGHLETVVDINGSKDDSIVVENGKADLQETLYSALVLEIPTKILCKEDCKGLCFKCGRNLNHEQCECKTE